MHQCCEHGTDRTYHYGAMAASTHPPDWIAIRNNTVSNVSVFSVRILQLLLNTCLAVLFIVLTFNLPVAVYTQTANLLAPEVACAL